MGKTALPLTRLRCRRVHAKRYSRCLPKRAITRRILAVVAPNPGGRRRLWLHRWVALDALVDGTDQIEPAGRHRLLETAIVISVLRPTVAHVWPEGLNHRVDRDKR